MIDIKTIEQQTIDLVRQVGRFIKEQRAQFDASKIEHKGLHDYVSSASALAFSICWRCCSSCVKTSSKSLSF